MTTTDDLPPTDHISVVGVSCVVDGTRVGSRWVLICCDHGALDLADDGTAAAFAHLAKYDADEPDEP